jgi:hypothetical protein
MIAKRVGDLNRCSIECRIQTVFLHEFLMCPELGDLSVVQHQDLVCSSSGGEPMSDEDDRLSSIASCNPLDLVEHAGLSMCVQRRGLVVFALGS